MKTYDATGACLLRLLKQPTDRECWERGTLSSEREEDHQAEPIMRGLGFSIGDIRDEVLRRERSRHR